MICSRPTKFSFSRTEIRLSIALLSSFSNWARSFEPDFCRPSYDKAFTIKWMLLTWKTRGSF
jgi:hypothetical protein